jgi:hypothetical protein
MAYDGLPWTSKETERKNQGKFALREAVTQLKRAADYLESHILRVMTSENPLFLIVLLASPKNGTLSVEI